MAQTETLPLSLRNPGRVPEDWVAIHLPPLYRSFAAFVWNRLPARSRFRRAILKRAVRRSYNAFGRGDLPALEGMYHPDCELDFTHYENFIGGPLYHGYEGLRHFLSDLEESWGDTHYELTELHFVGDRAFASCHHHSRGRHTRIDVERTFSQVGDVRNGLILRVDNYTNRDEALSELGLRGGP